MPVVLTNDQVKQYVERGYVSSLDAFSSAHAAAYRDRLEAME